MVRRWFSWAALALLVPAAGRADPELAARDYYGQGVAAYEERDYDRAVAAFNEALRLDPQHALAYWGRGSAHARRGDYARAVADYGEALRLGATDAQVYYGRGNAY